MKKQKFTVSYWVSNHKEKVVEATSYEEALDKVVDWEGGDIDYDHILVKNNKTGTTKDFSDIDNE